ncbi:MAG TPA: HPF/RaiA family ribosome-associated protein [Thermoanaerobaculia bacterium]|nr:HPF/RaiA family ribosome-associated protein [Thermoanaerobaculia bacterium]
MQIQINTDSNIDASDELVQELEAVVSRALDRFGTQVTRVEVHLSDENSGKFGVDDKRCLLEARLADLQPIAVSHEAATIQQAAAGAAEKLQRSLESRIGRLRDR